MTTIVEVRKCPECGSPMSSTECLNADCTSAQAAATKDASRETLKAMGSVAAEPRAFTSSGRVD